MNWIFRSASVGAMVGSLAAPLYRAQDWTVGVVLDAESAHISNGLLTSGTSLYSADVVKTESQGHVQLRVRQTRLQLAGQSEAAFFPGANGAVTELRQGTMVVALDTASESFEVFVSDVRIIPKNERPVLAEVTMQAPCDFQIKVMHGHLEATAAKESETLDQGTPTTSPRNSTLMTHATRQSHRMPPNTVAGISTVHAGWLRNRAGNLASREKDASRKWLSPALSV
jgi:hypothetical protein